MIVLLCSAPCLAAPPNIVLILADDLGINDLECDGRAEHHTPRLNQLASEGARFTSAYCGLSICSASRAALMTGKSPARLHLTTYLPGRPDTAAQKLLHPPITQQLPLEEITIAERLKALGYATGCVGKWHLGGQGFLPTDQGFDEFVSPPADTEPSDSEGGKGEFAIADKAVDFINRHKAGPFFLYVAHNNPHVRLAAKPALVEKYRDTFNPIYAGMIETLDDSVGRVLDALQQQALDANTIVIFTSDNGGLHVLESPNTPATHNTPYRAGKGYLYEGGLRAPLIIRWPGQIPPQVAPWIMSNLDWTPTLMEFVGGAAPEGVDGISMAKSLREQTPPPDRPFFFHFPHYTNQGSRPAGAIRDGDWKLIEYYDNGALELFNVVKDASELQDVHEAETTRTQEMRQRLADWRTAVGAQLNTPNPNYNAELGKPIYEDFDSSKIVPRRTAAETAPLFEEWRARMDAAVKAAKR
jgi:arylsulfatase A-like enzyme